MSNSTQPIDMDLEYLEYQKWRDALPAHLIEGWESQSAQMQGLLRSAYREGFKKGVSKGRTIPRSRESCRLSSYTKSILDVHGERDRLAASNRELTRTLKEAFESNSRMHKIVDGIEDLLTKDI